MKIEFDDGFSFGRGAFETIKVVDKKPLFLKEHLKRLKNSLKFFEITQTIDEEKIFDYIKDSADSDFALKIIVSDKNFVLTSREDNYKNNDKSFRLTISDVRRNSTSKMVYHKSLCYYENILVHRSAVSNGFDTALFLNERGEIAETAFANVFFVREGKIFTPPISSGILKGTMRDYLLEKYDVTEKAILFDDIKNYDEAFISNALMGVKNVLSIDDVKFNQELMTKTIQKDLKKLGF